MNWSQKYFPHLNAYQHEVNNQWFNQMLSRLSDDGRLIVPDLQKAFNKLGQEVKV
tara:strand:- start:59 stop:223 length:165 start_codon:yes stop_codon:yes gene_type:complete